MSILIIKAVLHRLPSCDGTSSRRASEITFALASPMTSGAVTEITFALASPMTSGAVTEITFALASPMTSGAVTEEHTRLCSDDRARWNTVP